jgi:hypothetical protein
MQSVPVSKEAEFCADFKDLAKVKKSFTDKP